MGGSESIETLSATRRPPILSFRKSCSSLPHLHLKLALVVANVRSNLRNELSESIRPDTCLDRYDDLFGVACGAQLAQSPVGDPQAPDQLVHWNVATAFSRFSVQVTVAPFWELDGVPAKYACA